MAAAAAKPHFTRSWWPSWIKLYSFHVLTQYKLVDLHIEITLETRKQLSDQQQKRFAHVVFAHCIKDSRRPQASSPPLELGAV
jgi:hypothetical protein